MHGGLIVVGSEALGELFARGERFVQGKTRDVFPISKWMRDSFVIGAFQTRLILLI